MDLNCKLFAEKFVVKRWQERFCFELKKKPGKLHDRVCKNYEHIFEKEALHDSPKNGTLESGLIYIIDWGNTFTEMTWGNFLRDYTRSGAGFLALSFDGTFGFLETHCSHPKYSKEWYIY